MPAHPVIRPNDLAEDRPRLFTVRIWSEVSADGIERRGQVRDVTTGAFRSFRSWSELTSFLTDRVAELPSGTYPKVVEPPPG
jgi:hypothetical protein